MTNNALINLLEDLEGESPKNDEVEIARLTRLIEAIDGVLKTKDWQTLVELHFSKEKERVERLLLSETKKIQLEDKEIYRLQGELKWGVRYADLRRWAEFLKNQLTELKHGN